jgi:amino acid transporter
VSGAVPLRHLGRLGLTAFGINSVIGGGIFILPAVVAGLVGAASLAAYVVAGLVVGGVGLSLARLASRFEESGGPYLYVHRAFGGFAGFQAGWLFCLARLTAMASLLNGFARYLGALVPWGSGTAARAAFVGLCALFVVGTNVAGIRQTSGVTNLLAVVKIAPLVAIGVAGLFVLEPANFVVPELRPIDCLRAVLLLIFAFSGFEILTVPAEESLRPRRDMPVALFGTIVAVTVIYLIVHTASLGMLPGLAAEKAPLATAAGMLAGPPGRYGMTAVAALSTAGCALASLVGGSRMLYAMSSAGQIPAWIGALNSRLKTPAVASLLVGALATALAIFGRYEWLSAVSAGARLLVYLACGLACLRPAPDIGPAGRAAAGVTVLAIAVLLFGLERNEVVAGIIGIGLGIGLYLAARRNRAALHEGGEVA